MCGLESVDIVLTDTDICDCLYCSCTVSSFPLCVYVQEMAEVTVPDLPLPPPQDSSTDILPDGALGEMNALGRAVRE